MLMLIPWPLCFDVLLYDWTDLQGYINSYYNNIVGCLRQASIPRKKHSYQKYWWDEELTLLKQKAIQSFNIWSSVGKPRMGTFFDTMRRDKAAYKLAIRTKEKDHVNEFSDSLNDALMSKDMDRFWKNHGGLSLVLNIWLL